MSDNIHSMTSNASMNSFNFEEIQVEFVNLDPKLICVKCNTWLKNPRQNVCGHRFCLKCLDKLLEDSSQIILCPSGDKDCEPITRDKVYPDASAMREIKQAKVYCIYKRFGCEETPSFAKFLEHITGCAYVSCCQFCQQRLPPEELQEHVNKWCREAPVCCEYSCGISQKCRWEMEEHYVSCPSKPQRCKFRAMGCQYESKRSEMSLHEEDNTKHLEIVVTRVAELDLAFTQLQGKFENVLAERDSASQQIVLLRREKEELFKTISSLQENVQRVEERLTQSLTALSGKMTQVTSQVQAFEPQVHEVALLRSKYSQLENKVQELDVINPRQGTSSTSAAGLPEEMRNKFVAHDKTISTHEVRLSEIDLRLQCAETANFEGLLIWKIGDYWERKKQAVDGRILSLYSQPFYTSRYGYKMCARVYLNGDGVGRNTHMSLFFVVMQGDYDDILAWPFRQKVTLSLLDQVQNRRHLVDTFKPDPSSSSFQKPSTPMNVASGCPLFVPHTTLESQNEPYLRKNTLFIRVVVDSSDLVNF